MGSLKTPECGCRITQDFDLLRQTEVFSGAPTEVVKLFAYLARHRTFKDSEQILEQGSKADQCCLLVRGEVNILTRHQNHDIVVQRLKPGSFFGELALLARFNWFFSAKAVGETEVLIISRESFQHVLDKYPERREKIAEKVIQLRISRFENQTAYLLDMLVEAGIASTDPDMPLIG